MVIFNSYVSIPEGSIQITIVTTGDAHGL
jgi:hypothetical protein